MIYLQKRVIDQNGRSPSSTENSKIRCGMTDIYGPKNSGKYWIDDGYIYGPKHNGRFWVDDGHIYGPSKTLPWHE